MANTTSVIPRLDDKTALELFRELQSKSKPKALTLQATGLDQLDILAPDESVNKLVADLSQGNSYLITRIAASYSHFSIVYLRNQDPARLSAFYDEIQINHTENQSGGLDRLQRLALVQHVNSKISLGNVHRRDEVAAKSIEDLQTIYHSTILNLESSFAEQIKKITDWTVEQTGALEQHKLKLGEDTAAERERLSKEYEAKSEALRQATDELEKKRKELDDRAYMHARRGIRSDLQRTIKERQQKFTLTPETRRLRTPVHIALIGLLVILGAVNYATVQAVLALNFETAGAPVLVWAFGKQTVVTLAFVGALFFYVRWMNRWFEQHASAEFLLKQFELDIDRASWVVETAMEWRRDQNAEIPTSLLEGITRNLFADGGDSAQAHSAADDLASALVGNASQLKVKLGNNELNFDRKGLAGLGKIDA